MEDLGIVNTSDAALWIRALGLVPHPEGGYYRETWRSDARDSSGRSLATAIYFLLEGTDFSAFHRLDSDEIWHFHAGNPLILTMIAPGGARTDARLGRDPARGEMFQAIVPAGSWFAAALDSPGGWALVGCTTTPGFEFADWELGGRADLLRAYPQHREVIEKLTRG